MGQLVKVDFYGDSLECLRNDEGVWVSLKRICEALGIDQHTQKLKLENRAWATIGQCPTVAEDGRKREMTVLHIDSLPMWLATIDAERVADEARPKIELYQRECAKALRDYWFKGETVNPHKPANDVKMLNALRLEAKERRLNAELLMRTLKIINEAKPLHVDVFVATAAVVAETAAGRELPALKPKTEGEWMTPTLIAEQLGVTAARVGLTITELNIRGNIDGVARAVLNKAAYSDKTVTTYQYTPRALEMIRARLQEAPKLEPVN